MNNKIGNYQVLKSYLKYTIQKQMEIDEIISNLREFGSPYIYESNVGKNIFCYKAVHGFIFSNRFWHYDWDIGNILFNICPILPQFLDIFN